MKKISRGMVGYSIGYIGQGAVYNFISTYFILFMTDCIGMSSALSGLIMSLALLAEVFAGMIIGNISDGFQSLLGKRRPFILTAAVCMPLVIILLFRNIHGSLFVDFAYYLSLSVVFRIIFSTFEIPNNAFGAQIAVDYDERTRLRTSTRVFGIFGNMIAYVMPLLVLARFAEGDQGWRLTGLLIAALCCVSWLAAFFITRPYDLNSKASDGKPKKKVLHSIAVNYLQLLKLKTMRILIVYKAAFACALALFNVATIYYLKYCMGLSNVYTSYIYLGTVVIFLVSTPFINRTALKYGKGKQQLAMLLMGGLLGLVVYLFFRRYLLGAVIYICFFAVVQNSFWQLSPSIFYDIVEVDEFVNGQRREGDIMSLVSVLGTLTTSVVVQVFGVFYDLTGYDASLTIQPSSVGQFLSAAYILVPSLCFLIGAVALKAFPINKKTFHSLTEASRMKRAGENYCIYEEDLHRIFD